MASPASSASSSSFNETPLPLNKEFNIDLNKLDEKNNLNLKRQ